MVQLEPVKVRLNDIDGVLYAEHGMEGVFALHITDVAELLKQRIENRMVLRNYLLLEVLDEKDHIIGSTTWVPPATYTTQSNDGYERRFEIPYYTQIREVVPGIEGKELVARDPLAPPNRDMYVDINDASITTISVIGIIKHTPEEFQWGFNGGNGLRRFVDAVHQFAINTDTDKPRVIMYHDRCMGYHFVPATEKTIMKYYKIKG